MEHLKGIAFEQNALLYSFNEVTSSRDIHRPRKDAIGPVGSFDDKRCVHMHVCARVIVVQASLLAIASIPRQFLLSSTGVV